MSNFPSCGELFNWVPVALSRGTKQKISCETKLGYPVGSFSLINNVRTLSLILGLGQSTDYKKASICGNLERVPYA